MTSIGKSRLLVDDQLVVDLWDAPPSGENRKASGRVHLATGHPHTLRIEFAAEQGPFWRNLRIACMPELPADSIDQAASLAGKADVAIVFAGLGSEWESEGFDRPDMELPGRQAVLIERVAAANPQTVVVLNTGSPVQMNWLDRVAAVVQAWYIGQETGSAIADVLFGDVNPSGRLPASWPKRLQDNPAYLNYPGENGQVLYGEGLFVGYRYYDKKGIEPLFPFGYGLSYSSFEYRNLMLSEGEKGTVRVSVEIKNVGKLAGSETVQVYVCDLQSRLVRPVKELKAFAKVFLEAGEDKSIAIDLDEQAWAYYDPEFKRWVAEPGEFQILVGGSSREIRLTANYELGGRGILAGA